MKRETSIKPEDKQMMVRGEIAIQFGNYGCMGFDMENAEECGIVYACTPWVRHDSNLEELERMTEKLLRCYQGMTTGWSRWSGAMVRYAYKPYRK